METAEVCRLGANPEHRSGSTGSITSSSCVGHIHPIHFFCDFWFTNSCPCTCLHWVISRVLLLAGLCFPFFCLSFAHSENVKVGRIVFYTRELAGQQVHPCTYLFPHASVSVFICPRASKLTFSLPLARALLLFLWLSVCLSICLLTHLPCKL